MRFLLFGLLLCPFLLCAQCDSLISIKKDKFTESTTWSMPTPVMLTVEGAGTVMLWLSKFDKSTAAISTSVDKVGYGCTDENAVLYWIFTDGSKHKRNNQSGFNCTGSSTVYLDKKFKTLLKEKLIASVKIESRTSSVQGDIDMDEAKRLQLVAQCMFQ